MYRHYRVVRMQVKAERILEEIFNAYREEPSTLPGQFQAFVNQRGLERTICDYIAGMTDRYAIEEHQKLFNPLEKP
jgi:dGTPase